MATPRSVPLAADRPATMPPDYAERVYAGVLGKIIGVYLGRPFEGWRYSRIMQELGEIRYYVNDRHDVALKNHRLIVTDDDITGTFTFPRTIRDYPGDDIDAVRVGGAWLNYVIEGRTVLWWGGRGNSTEHTAYLALKEGVAPPDTGSIARNGLVVAEQVGAQIFVEGWAMACPGDPERAADLAGRAASVSHDGEALNAARVVAALVAHAFVEDDLDRLLDTARSLIPAGSLIGQVIDDVREWHATGEDWHAGRQHIDDRYGYERYGGNCHVVPNHALVIHALLHGGGDFSRSLSVVNTCGWDTDSNAGNVGCIAGVLGGLRGIDAGAAWRGPVRDRLYLPSADGGAAITDAAREATTIVGYGYALQGLPTPQIKAGARFHFEFPGSVQGFAGATPDVGVENVVGHSALGRRSLAVHCPPGAAAQALTPTFITPETIAIPPYGMASCPTLYPGQTVRARVQADRATVTVRLVAHAFGAGDERVALSGGDVLIGPGDSAELAWTVPGTDGQPIADVGVQVAPQNDQDAIAYLDYLTWDGEPDLVLSRPASGGRMWRHAWVDAVDSFDERWPEPFRLVQNRGLGMLIQGTREWHDYEVSADVTPHLARSAGLAARVQGLTRYYAVRLVGRSTAQLIKVLDREHVLGEQEFPWQFGTTYRLALAVAGDEIRAAVDDTALVATDREPRLAGGAIALLIGEGRTATHTVRVRRLPTT